MSEHMEIHCGPAVLCVAAAAGPHPWRPAAARRTNDDGTEDSRPSAAPTPAPPQQHVIDLPKADQRLGTAVVVLLDTSGSMAQSVPDKTGRPRPKEDMGRESLESIINSSRTFLAKHPDRVLESASIGFRAGCRKSCPWAHSTRRR